MRTLRRRRAVTLVEMLLMTFIGLGLMGFAWQLMRRSNYLSDSTSHSVELQVGVRNLLENMVRDVASCQQILAPTGDAKRNLSVARVPTDAVDTRLTKNPNKAFPFVHTNETGPVATDQKLDVVRIGYSWDATKRVVTRTEERGELVASSEGSTVTLLSKFVFNPAGAPTTRVLATSVEDFSLFYVGYDPVSGEPKFITPADPAGLGYEKTSVIAVRVKAQFDEGLYRDDLARPHIEIFTKLWSLKRQSDEVYKEYFSSTDEDLRW